MNSNNNDNQQPHSPTNSPSMWTTVSTSARAILISVENNIRDFLSGHDLKPFPTNPDPLTCVYLLGKEYTLNSQGYSLFMNDFARRPRFTYRSGFSPITPTNLTTDSGWGCMIRVGQSLLLEAILQSQFGRNHLLTPNPSYLKIMERFRDDPTSSFSIHALSHRGQTLDTNIGQWFGPTVLAQTIKGLVNDDPDSLLPVVVVAQDASVFVQDVIDAWNSRSDMSSLLLLIPLRLGLDQLHLSYWPFIQECFKSPQFVGIAGGRPSAALYMVGITEDTVLVLDPHFVQPAFTASATDLSTCTTDTIKCLPAKLMDPSLCLAFLFTTRMQWNEWQQWIQNLSGQNSMEVPICVQESQKWKEDLPDCAGDDEF